MSPVSRAHGLVPTCRGRAARIAPTGLRAYVARRLIALSLLGALIQLSALLMAPSGLAQGLPAKEFGGARLPEEVASLRTENSRTIVSPDGTQTAFVYPGPVHYKDADGAWQPIDNTLTRSSRPGYAYENAANAYKLHLPSELAGAPVRFQAGGEWATFALASARGRAEVSGATGTFRDALPGVTVAYETGNERVKETLTLASPAAASTFAFHLRTSGGVTPKVNGEGGIDFLDEAGKEKFAFAPPVMWDSSDTEEGFSSALTFRLQRVADGFALTLTADKAWLADPKREWPVVVDPTITTASDTQDCHLAQNGATTSYCSTTYLRLGVGSGQKRRAFLKFGLSGIPANATVTSANLWANCTRATTTNFADIVVRRVTRDWTNAATWNTYNGTNAWTTAGGDFGPDNWATRSLNCSTLGWKSWDTTELVKRWVNGTYVNNGLVLRQATETVENLLDFASREDSANAPYIRVEYNRAPDTVTSLTPASGTVDKLTTPTLSGVYNDPDGDWGSVWFELYRSSDGTLAASGWGQDVGAGQRSSWTVPSGRLTRGIQYHWYAIARDSVGAYGLWAGPSYYATSPNAAPNTPTELSPGSGTVSPNTTPTLSALYSDPDGDRGRVVFDMYDASTGTSVLEEKTIALGTEVNSGEVSVWTAPPLENGKRYVWRAWAYDGHASSGLSPENHYTVNAAPAVPTNLRPPTRIVATVTPELSAAFDDADGNAGTVEFRVYDDSGASVVTGVGSTVTPGRRSRWVVPAGALVDGRTYSWTAVARDSSSQSDVSASRVFAVSVGPDVYRAAVYTGNPAAGGTQLREEWARLNTLTARSVGDDVVKTRRPVACPPTYPSSEPCDEVRTATIDGAEFDSTEAYTVSVGPRDDSYLPQVASILDPATEGWAVAGSGATASVIEPWQTPPPRSDGTFVRFVLEHEAGESTLLWADARTLMPLKSVDFNASGTEVGSLYWSYAASPIAVSSLPADWFAVARPATTTYEKQVDYHRNDDLAPVADLETGVAFEPYYLGPDTVLPQPDGVAGYCLTDVSVVDELLAPSEHESTDEVDPELASDPRSPETTFVLANYATREPGERCLPGTHEEGDSDLTVMSMATESTLASVLRSDVGQTAWGAELNPLDPHAGTAGIQAVTMEGGDVTAYTAVYGGEGTTATVVIPPGNPETTVLVIGELDQTGVDVMASELQGQADA